MLNEETDVIDDFINLQLNSIQVCSVFIKKSEESAVLKNNYFKKLIKIAVFLISLQQLLNLTIKKFWKFKKETLRYMIFNQHLFQWVNKNIPLQRIIDSEKNQKTILTKMHNNSDHYRYEEIYQQITDHYWWGGFYKDVQRHIKTCKECQCRTLFKEEKELHFIYVSIA